MSLDGTTREQLTRMLDPDAIAVAGASRDESKRGYIAVKTLSSSSYDGDLYPVNPTIDGELLGHTVYPSVSSIPDPVDLVYVVTPATAVASVLEDAGEAGAAGAVIFSAGFSEAGNEEAEDDLVRVAEEHGIRFIGPNVMGLVNVPADVYLGIDADYDAGGLSMVSQSGNLGMTLGTAANRERNTGLSHFVSIGNEADVAFHEFLPYFAGDETTEAVVAYSEGMTDGRAFLQAARKVTPEKPVIVLSGGRTGAGKASAQSHTASLAGDADVRSQVYEQAGVHAVESFDDIVPTAQAVTGLPPLSGRNIAVMTEAGGVATIAADALVEHGLDVPTLSAATQDRLEELFPHSPNLSNPVDTMVSGETASLHGEAAEALLDDPTVDGLLICGAYGGYGLGGAGGIELPTDDRSAAAQLESAERLGELLDAYGKPIVIKSTFTPEESEALAICRDAGIPVYTDFRAAPIAFRALADYGEFLDTAAERSDFVVDEGGKSHDLVSTAVAEGRRLSEWEARKVVSAYGVPVAPGDLAGSADEAVAAASAHDGPVAMKIVSPDIPHKTESGGVALDVTGEAAVRTTYETLRGNATEYDPDASIDGVLVSPMVEEGVEVIVGATQDPEVGPVVLFGLGGVFAEVLEDVSFGAVPLTEYDARRMIHRVDGYEVLSGARGGPAADEDALVDLLLDVSDVVAENPEIAELDLNPVVCDEDGVTAVDASIHLDE